MKVEIERSRNVVAGETGDRASVAARVAVRIQRWFRRPEQESKRELDIRLEERHRERACFAVQQVPADSAGKQSAHRALRLMQRVTEDGRIALQGVRSSGIASMSLEHALSGIRDEFTPGGARFRVFVKGQPKVLNPEIQEQISLIGREALANALRHSKATDIEAEVEYSPRRLRLVVRDNGCGIDPQVVRSGREAHWGLAGMRERAGSIGAQLRIWSRPGAGTEVEISVPHHVVAGACA
jgi:signal transduction histidine kinase